MSKLLIISYCDRIRTNAHINHARYAAQHGHDYLFDIAPTKHTHFFAKIEKIKKLLSYTDWLFWIDDDAYFIDFEKNLSDYIDESKHLIFCNSPKDSGVFTWISSGNFFLKNTPEVHALLDACLSTELDTVRDWWDPELYGKFTNGDQDALVYQMHHHPQWSEKGYMWLIHQFNEFNSRPRHFLQEPTKHFLVHFVGNKKHLQVLKFAQDMGLTDDLSPNSAPAVITKYPPPFREKHPRIYRYLRQLGLTTRD